MKRLVYNELLKWKDSVTRKPLIVDGARQVGKTWILKEFGRNEFRNVVYINCDRTVEMKGLFFDFDTDRLLRAFGSIVDESIVPGETLIILDEVQETPLGITALKYFCEDAPQYHIIVAGSLLGISLHGGSGFPVGKVDRLNMYPMTFSEFLEALGKIHLLELLQSRRWVEISSLASTFIELLRQYYFVGGMPEAVASYIANDDLLEVRAIQERISED